MFDNKSVIWHSQSQQQSIFKLGLSRFETVKYRRDIFATAKRFVL